MRLLAAGDVMQAMDGVLVLRAGVHRTVVAVVPGLEVTSLGDAAGAELDALVTDQRVARPARCARHVPIHGIPSAAESRVRVVVADMPRHATRNRIDRDADARERFR
jgi:hypothetical protein